MSSKSVRVLNLLGDVLDEIDRFANNASASVFRIQCFLILYRLLLWNHKSQLCWPGQVAPAIRSFDHNLSHMGCGALQRESMGLCQGNTGWTNRTLILYESGFWVFVLQVTGIDWQPSGILTCGLDSLRGATPGRKPIGWQRRSSPPRAQHSSAFLMSPEGSLEWATAGGVLSPPPSPCYWQGSGCTGPPV